ncbi:glycosyltransferase family 4 protein [Paenibacillus graminis]|uniref:glycosyltransferase family 4 protein n=1 Tax=Paenibacillus graminis TaxID=189425 RepID=UPI002DBF2AD1|nr:glycosyltransferase family 4 protein [Paenibacillus graminis]MEC0171590.1 glycosyltransferase family 4 protein [Paenibacillus graminis]
MQSRASVLILSWEYPPVVIGGMAPHVYELSRHLACGPAEVHVITNSAPGRPVLEVENGVYVHRVNSYENLTDFEDWVLEFNLAIVDYVASRLSGNVRLDLIHAHDWLVGYAALLLRQQLKLPLVTTVHATEYGRNQGLFTPQQHMIHAIEHELVTSSDKVIVCSLHMQREVCAVHGVDESGTEIIPNGIDLRSMELIPAHSFRREHYAQDGGKIVLFIGRLVKEKGVQVLLQSMHEVLREFPHCTCIIAGRGPMYAELEASAAELGTSIRFTGFVDSQEKSYLLQIADVCVFPSLYEPFGIVALEAMGSGTPVIVSEAGGLTEIVEHGRTGLTSIPGDPEMLAGRILQLLRDPDEGSLFAEAARREVLLRYDWQPIADRTGEVYSTLSGVRL